MSEETSQQVPVVEDGVDARAREVEAQLTDDERFSLLVSVMGTNDVVPVRDERIPPDTPMSAGYVTGVPRLGVPALLMSDASLGVTNPGYRPGDTATALPAGRRAAVASTCNWPAGSTWPATRATGATSNTCPRTRC